VASRRGPFAAEDDRGEEVSACGARVWVGAATAAAGTGEVEVPGEVCGVEAGCGVTAGVTALEDCAGAGEAGEGVSGGVQSGGWRV
jgi:hypothetical protein